MSIPPFVSVLLEGKPDSTVETCLAQNVPNPFTHEMRTEISFQNGAIGHVTLRVLNINGKEIARLYDYPDVPPGRFRVAWLGVDSTGKYVAPGLYRYQLVTANKSLARSLLITPGLHLQGEHSAGSVTPPPVFPEPARTLESLMAAYRKRDTELYRSLLAEEFRRVISPGDLSWGKVEEIESIQDLFASPGIASLSFAPEIESPRDSASRDHVIVPLAGGELVIRSQDNQELRIPLGSQEIIFRRTTRVEGKGFPSTPWEIATWREYGVPTSDPRRN